MPAFIDALLHLDRTLGSVIAHDGAWTYALIFLIVFCETGLILTPFLPGDSLLFAAGAFAATGTLNVWLLFPLVFIAAVAGNTFNYRVGLRIGHKVTEEGKLFGLPVGHAHFEKTHAYFRKYGTKTIVFARFIPIVRTFAPFVAGIGEMPSSTFMAYNVVGALIWSVLVIFSGYFFGNLPAVKNNFEFVILAIVGVSVLPVAIEYFRSRRKPHPEQPTQ